MTRTFEQYCNEPAFPDPYFDQYGTPFPGTQHGLNRLEYFTSEMLKLPAFDLHPAEVGEERKVKMLQVVYHAEDMLRSLWLHQNLNSDSETIKHPAK